MIMYYSNNFPNYTRYPPRTKL